MGERRFRILVADDLAESGVAWLRNRDDVDLTVLSTPDEAELAEAAAEADALLVRSRTRVTAAVIEGSRRLRVIGRAGIGVDNIDLAAATARGVVVMNVPDANAETTAEHALALLFAAARRIPEADRSLREGRWERKRLLGVEIAGKTLGIVGCGNIGSRVARRALGLGLKTLAYDPYLSPDAALPEGVLRVDLGELLARSDFLTIHVPLTDDTRGLVGASFLSSMRPGSILVQCSRGGVVDEAALVRALEEGPLAAAAVDVFAEEPPPPDHPLLSLPNVVLTPHLGASTREAQERASRAIARQVVEYLLNGAPVNAVNLVGIDAEQVRSLEPWIELARRLGAVAAALEPRARRLAVEARGEIARRPTSVLLRAAAAGYLARFVEHPPNLVNASLLAAERGVELEERRRENLRDFASMLVVHAVAEENERSAAGTLFGARQLRLVAVDGRPLEAIPEGTLLVVANEDRPGVVGRIGSALGAAGVNISSLHLAPPGRRHPLALLVASLSTPPPDEAIERIRALPEVSDVRTVALGGPSGSAS